MPMCPRRLRASRGRSIDRMRTIPLEAARLRARAVFSAPDVGMVTMIIPLRVMVRSVLRDVQGHETRFHADVTDRDRDESSRRAISAWVRTNPQTQVR